MKGAIRIISLEEGEMKPVRPSSERIDGSTSKGNHRRRSFHRGFVWSLTVVLPICFLSSYQFMVIFPRMLTVSDDSSYDDLLMTTAKVAGAQSIHLSSQTTSSSSVFERSKTEKIEGTLGDVWTGTIDDDGDDDDNNNENDDENASVKSRCPVSDHDGARPNDKSSPTTPFQDFCSTIGKEQFKTCQILRTKTAKTQQQHRAQIEATAMATNSTRIDNIIKCNLEGKESLPNEEEKTTLWVTGMSLGFGEPNNGYNDGEYDWREDDKKNKNRFLDEYIAALESWKANANDVLQPVLIIMTPTRPTTASISHKLPPFGQYVQEKYGVIVLLIHSLSFEDIVYSNHPSYRTTGEIGYYLRFDIPRIFLETHQIQLHQKLLERHQYHLHRKEQLLHVSGKVTNTLPPSNCNNASTTTITSTIGEWYDLDKVLYTDSDILFVNAITNHELYGLKSQVSSDPKEKFLMFGQDYLINRPKPSNTGVMIMDIVGFTHKWPKILEWGKAAAARQELPEHDQLWLNRYYDAPKKWSPENVLLPPTWNWKVYWQIDVLPASQDAEVLNNFQGDDINNANNQTHLSELSNQLPETNPPISDIKIIHFHGPKPFGGLEELGRCDYEHGILGKFSSQQQQQQQKSESPAESNSTGSAPSTTIVGVGTVKPTYQMFVSSGMCCDYGRTTRAVLKLYDRWRPKRHYWIDDEYHLKQATTKELN